MEIKRKFYEDFYKFLGHSCVELRVISNGTVLFQDSNIRDPFVFSKICLGYDGKGQVYFGIQERDGKGGSYENVPSLSWIPIDVDAKRPNKQTQPATEEQKANAYKNVVKIAEYLNSNGVKQSLAVDTVNGYLLLIKIPQIETKEHFYKTGEATQNELSDKVNYFLQHVIKPLCDDTVEIDSVGDLPRVLGVPGTINMKGGRRRTVIAGDILESVEPQSGLWSLIAEAYENREEAVAITEDTLKLGEKLYKKLPEDLRKKYHKSASKKLEDIDRSRVLWRTMIYLANRGYGISTLEPVFNGFFIPKIGRNRWPVRQQYEKAVSEGKILSELQLIKRELDRSKAISLHPLIDYNARTQLSYGSLLHASQKAVIITPEKAFTA